MKPRILYSEMTDTWYIATRYKNLGEGRFVALTKYGVTEKMDAILQGQRAFTFKEAAEIIREQKGPEDLAKHFEYLHLTAWAEAQEADRKADEADDRG